MCGVCYSRWESGSSHLSPWVSQVNGCQDSPLDFSLVPPHCTSHCMGYWILYDAVSYGFKAFYNYLTFIFSDHDQWRWEVFIFNKLWLLIMIYIRVVTFIGSGSHMDYTRRWVYSLWYFFLGICSCSPKGRLCTLRLIRVRKHHLFSLLIRYTRSMECLPFSRVTDLQMLNVRVCSTYRSSFSFGLTLYNTSST